MRGVLYLLMASVMAAGAWCVSSCTTLAGNGVSARLQFTDPATGATLVVETAK